MDFQDLYGAELLWRNLATSAELFLTCKRSRTPFSSAGISCARSTPRLPPTSPPPVPAAPTPCDSFLRDAGPAPPLPPLASIGQAPSVPAPLQVPLLPLAMLVPFAAEKSCARLSLGRTKRAVADPYSKCQPEALSGRGTYTGTQAGSSRRQEEMISGHERRRPAGALPCSACLHGMDARTHELNDNLVVHLEKRLYCTLKRFRVGGDANVAPTPYKRLEHLVNLEGGLCHLFEPRLFWSVPVRSRLFLVDARKPGRETVRVPWAKGQAGWDHCAQETNQVDENNQTNNKRRNDTRTDRTQVSSCFYRRSTYAKEQENTPRTPCLEPDRQDLHSRTLQGGTNFCPILYLVEVLQLLMLFSAHLRRKGRMPLRRRPFPRCSGRADSSVSALRLPLDQPRPEHGQAVAFPEEGGEARLLVPEVQQDRFSVITAAHVVTTTVFGLKPFVAVSTPLFSPPLVSLLSLVKTWSRRRRFRGTLQHNRLESLASLSRLLAAAERVVLPRPPDLQHLVPFVSTGVSGWTQELNFAT